MGAPLYVYITSNWGSALEGSHSDRWGREGGGEELLSIKVGGISHTNSNALLMIYNNKGRTEIA